MPNREFYYEQGPQDNTGHSTEEVVKLATEFGSPRLDHLTAEECQKLLELFKENKLPSKDYIAYFEQFIQHNLLSDAEALGLVKGSLDEQKRSLLIYLVNVIPPTKFIQTRYECTLALDSGERDKLIAKELTSDPASLIAWAPFITGIDRLPSKEKDATEKPPKSLTVLEAHFTSPENATLLLDNLFLFLKSDFQPAYNLKKLFEFYKKNQRYILYPYLEQFSKVDTDMISEKDIMSFFKESQDGYMLKATPQERRALDDLGQLKQYYTGEEANTPESKIFAAEDLRDQMKIRAAKHILKDYSTLKECFDLNTKEFVSFLLDSGIPALNEIANLDLEAEDLKDYSENYDSFQLSNFSDIQAVLVWAKAKNQVDLVEENIWDKVVVSIATRRNIVRIDRVIDLFTEKTKNKIIVAINQDNPRLWFLNLDYAIRNQVMPTPELLETITEGDEWEQAFFVSYLNRILYQLNKLEGEGVDVPGMGEIKKVMDKIFRAHPDFIFDSNIEKTANHLYDEEAVYEIINDNLTAQPVDNTFFLKLVRALKQGKYASRNEPLKQSCVETLTQDPLLFIGLIEQELNFSLLKWLVPKPLLISLLIKHLPEMNWSQVFNYDIINLFLQPPRFQSIIKSAIKYDNIAGLGHVLKRISATLFGLNREKVQEREKQEAKLEEYKKLHPETLSPKLRAGLKKHIKLTEAKIYSKEQSVSPEFIACFEARSAIQLELLELLKFDPSKVFDEAIFKEMQGVAGDLIRDNVEKYLETHPEVLLMRDENNKSFALSKILGQGKFEELCTSRIRSLAFLHNRSDRYTELIRELPKNVTEQIQNINKVFNLESNSTLTVDYYDQVIILLKNDKFFPIFENKLKDIAKKEQKLYGPRLDLEYFRAESNFKSIIDNIELLEACPVAIKNSEAILALESDKQEEIIGALGFISLYHLDEHLDFDLESDGYETVKTKLLDIISDFVRRLFEMGEVKIDAKFIPSTKVMQAMSIYYRKMCKGEPVMRKTVRTLISNVFNGSYISWRQWGTEETPSDNEQKFKSMEELKSERLLPPQLTLSQYELWNSEDSFSISEVLVLEANDITTSMSDVLKRAIADGHVTEEEIISDQLTLTEEYKELLEPIKGLSGKEVSQYKQEHAEEFLRIEALTYLNRLRVLSGEELESGKLKTDLSKRAISLESVFTAIEKHFITNLDFIGNIREIRLIFEDYKTKKFGKKVVESNLVLTDKIDLETYLCIGEFPVPSCQHYDGNSGYSAGLLSYLVDPDVKIIQMRNDAGQFIARAVMRMLEDEDGVPQLVTETVYSVNPHKRIKKMLDQFVDQKARVIGVQSWNDDKARSGKTLYHRGSRNAYIYTDRGGGKVKKGIFKIQV